MQGNLSYKNLKRKNRSNSKRKKKFKVTPQNQRNVNYSNNYTNPNSDDGTINKSK